MRIFLSGLESAASQPIIKKYEQTGKRIAFGLMSYYYIQHNSDGYELFKRVMNVCDYVLIDSGAHTFQLKDTGTNYEEYTQQYANFIRKVDCDKILGFFEMDVDKEIGYKRVYAMRKQLEKASPKIIPVWHKGRGIEEFKRMCKETPSEIVAITGFRNEDIKDNQYGAFVKYAWSQGKKIHCLGMTRTKVLNSFPFDFVDSSTWLQKGNYGLIGHFKKGKMPFTTTKKLYKSGDLHLYNFIEYQKMVKYYNRKWHKVNHDLYHFKQAVRNFPQTLKLGVITCKIQKAMKQLRNMQRLAF